MKFNLSGSLGKLKDKFFARPKDLVYIDLSSGKVAIKGDGNYTTCSVDDKGAITLENQQLDAFLRPIPAIAMRKSTKELKVGDIIIIDGKVSNKTGIKTQYARFISKVNAKTGAYKTARPTGSETEFIPVVDSLLKDSGALVVSNFFGKGGSVDTAALLPLMLMGDGFDDAGSEDLMTLMMMGGGGDGFDGNSLLPLMMMGDKGGDNDMLPLLLMQGLGKGKGKSDISSILPLLMMGDKGGAGGGKLQKLLMFQAMSGGKGGLGDLFGKDSNPMMLMAMLG